MKKQAGFTLIELVTVIIILGILAAFAVPRFIDLSTQARAAATQGLGGSVQAAAALAHSVAVANGVSTTSSPVKMDGVNIDMKWGYPTASSTGIVAALQSTQGFAGSTAGTTTTLFLKTLTSHDNCEVSYTEPTTASATAAIAIDTSDCG
ncbi:MAG TPA: type II secretion system protein [Gammaproteobacteria bacterium]|nr:type II secretion system protein [Gammaproteobacteria bacterium]